MFGKHKNGNNIEKKNGWLKLFFNDILTILHLCRWFLPGCPLAYVFGPDPLRFYPWNKFCGEYSAFDNTEFCPKKSREKGEQGKEADVDENEKEARISV